MISFLVKLLVSPEFWRCIELNWDALGFDSPVFGAACRTKKSTGFKLEIITISRLDLWVVWVPDDLSAFSESVVVAPVVG